MRQSGNPLCGMLLMAMLLFSLLAGTACKHAFADQLLPANEARPNSYSQQIELLLNDIFKDIRQFDLRSAGDKTTQLTHVYPDFALGQLLHAELMAARSLTTTLAGSDQPYSPRLLELIMEAQSRLRHSTLAVDNTRLPDNLLQIGDDIAHIVAVDLEYSRLYLVKNQNHKPRVVAHHYAASGRGGYGKLVEGDLRTPTGVYRLIEFKPESSLPELYGAGALTLDYPNALDRYYNRTGSGIWLHGIPRSDLSRAPRSSEGCVVMPNDLFLNLRDTLNLASTLVVLSGELGWQKRQELQHESAKFVSLFNEWRQAWIENDATKLNRLYKRPRLQHASLGFSPPARLQQAMRGLADVRTEQVTIIRYPVFPDSVSRIRTKKSKINNASLNASENSAQLSSQVMMQFTLPSNHAVKAGSSSHNSNPDQPSVKHRVTLYWELDNQHPRNKHWKIVEIKHDPKLI